MLGLRQHQLRCSWTSSTCRTSHGSCCRVVGPSAMSLRRATCCGAGKRTGSTAAAQQRNGKLPKQQSSGGVRDDASQIQGSALTRMVTSRISSAASLQEMEDAVSEWGSSFDFIHTSAAFVKAGKLVQHKTAAASRWALLDRLATLWDSQMPHAEPRQLSNVLWACGKLQYANPQLWSRTLAAFREQLHHGQQQVVGQDVANVLHGAANAALANKGDVPGVPRAELEACVSELGASMRLLVTHPLLEGVDSQSIANTLWALAKLRINPGDAALNSMLQAMSRPALQEGMVPQDFSNMLWAVSELRCRCSWQPQLDQRVWQRLVGELQLQRTAQSGAPLAIATSVAALASLSMPAAGTNAAAVAAPLFDKQLAQACALQLLQGKVAQQRQGWTAQILASTMSACKQLGVSDSSFGRSAAAEPPQ